MEIEMKITKPIQVEPSFDAFVRDVGGRVLKDELGNSPTFKNADYIFDKEQIVAELKCLEEDKLDDPKYLAQIEGMWQKWKASGFVEGEPPETIWLDKLPTECARELFFFASKALKRVVEKANSQIKETKAHLQLQDYFGLLLIANDGNFALPAETIDKMLGYVLNDKYSSIDCYVLFSVNMVTSVPGVDFPCTIWLPRDRSEKCRYLDGFLSSLNDKWLAYREMLTDTTYVRVNES